MASNSFQIVCREAMVPHMSLKMCVDFLKVHNQLVFFVTGAVSGASCKQVISYVSWAIIVGRWEGRIRNTVYSCRGTW